MKEVWVTGIGFITSIGNDRSSVTDSLINLKHGIVNPAEFQVPDSPVKVAGTIKEFDLEPSDPEDWVYPEKYRLPRATLRSFSPMFFMRGVPFNRQLKMRNCLRKILKVPTPEFIPHRVDP